MFLAEKNSAVLTRQKLLESDKYSRRYSCLKFTPDSSRIQSIFVSKMKLEMEVFTNCCKTSFRNGIRMIFTANERTFLEVSFPGLNFVIRSEEVFENCAIVRWSKSEKPLFCSDTEFFCRKTQNFDQLYLREYLSDSNNFCGSETAEFFSTKNI